MLTIDTIPLRLLSILDFEFQIENEKNFHCSIVSRKSKIENFTIYSLYANGGNGNDYKTF